MPFGWGETSEHYQNVYDDQGQPREASFGQEVLAGGAAFAGFKAFEDHRRKEGMPVKHAFAKEALAGFVGLEVDKFGQNEYDKEKLKREAREHADQMYDDHYGGQDQHDPGYGPPPQMQQQFPDQYGDNQQGFRGDQGYGGNQGYGGDQGGYGGNQGYGGQQGYGGDGYGGQGRY